MIICTSVNERYELEIFPKAKFLILYDTDKKEIIKEIRNTEHSRPKVTKKCLELNPEVLLAPHGSLCFPSYSMAKRAGVKILIDNPNKSLNEINPWNVNMKEVVYSSFLAIYQRFSNHY
ncbi:hypothetical protein DFR86_04905 [Acidianus sulfidivorans JP7]|uniref:Dinitrogenase iron-molybdenum cofactor biosynthesis domain-containing protein n=1 Tax=Acidianus sulfidivorans JP7 TaxID=619593 RepID=A0A2U9IM24_9CREN|nr:hypothetical protein [Acidianus sulfidivorans]AWR96964.1 hypothetical protein DFR86_04905 [Acidianus sulfidivorans JP7]